MSTTLNTVDASRQSPLKSDEFFRNTYRPTLTLHHASLCNNFFSQCFSKYSTKQLDNCNVYSMLKVEWCAFTRTARTDLNNNLKKIFSNKYEQVIYFCTKWATKIIFSISKIVYFIINLNCFEIMNITVIKNTKRADTKNRKFNFKSLAILAAVL